MEGNLGKLVRWNVLEEAKWRIAHEIDSWKRSRVGKTRHVVKTSCVRVLKKEQRR